MSQIDSTALDVLQDLASELKKRETIKSDNQPTPLIQRKEFYWDEVLKWLVAASFGLSFLDVSVEFFCNYTVTCYVPNGTSRDDVAYINNYCLLCVFILHFVSYHCYVMVTLYSFFLIIIVLIYAFVWCLLCHSKELGHKTVATFCTQSNLPQDSYFSSSPLKNPCTRGIKNFCTPGIRSDLDFLVLMLFRTSSGQGATFKELQIMREMKHQYHQLSMNRKAQTHTEDGNSNEQVSLYNEHNSMNLLLLVYIYIYIYIYTTYFFRRVLKARYIAF